MTKGTFGESLKREREMRGVTLDEITVATRIATRFLRPLKTNSGTSSPAASSIGFVRAVARYLGLDEENIVAEYILAVGDRPSVPVWTGSPPGGHAGTTLASMDHRRRQSSSALLAGGWFGTRRFLAWRAAKRAAQAAELSAAASPETASSASSNVATPPTAADPAAPNSSSAAAAPVPAAATAATTLATAADPASTAAPVSTANDPIKLKIETGKKTKVIVVADNDVVFDGTMRAGENAFLLGHRPFRIYRQGCGRRVCWI